MVINASVKAAMLLALGRLFTNREDVVAGQIMELPLGSQYLLRAYRRVMMP